MNPTIEKVKQSEPNFKRIFKMEKRFTLTYYSHKGLPEMKSLGMNGIRGEVFT